MQIETNRYLKDKAQKALIIAKGLETKQRNQGAKYVRIDRKTMILRK